jgi:DNA-binding transcriptional regulator YdaS (Cro superfamily)
MNRSPQKHPTSTPCPVQALLAKLRHHLDAQPHGARAQLARELSLHPQQLTNWLNGTKAPSATHALTLNAWLNGQA